MFPTRIQDRTFPARLGRSLVAGLSLLVLFASWLPHDHEAAAVPSDSSSASVASSPTFSVTADDSHHTHSSRQSAEELLCTLCRGAGEREEFATLDPQFSLPERALVGSPTLFREPARKPDPRPRLHLGRAPPASVTS